ncbi:MAG: nuclear transport factor 2 family protein [Pseudomonadales bacterium]
MNLDIEQLIAEREIYRQLVKFAGAMDAKDWPAFEQLTLTDIEADVGLGLKKGREPLVETMRQFLDNCGVTQHLLGNVLIEVDGDTADSQSYVADMHLGLGNKSELSFRTLGIYYDQWQRVDGCWLMSSRKKDNRATMGSMDVFSGVRINLLP